METLNFAVAKFNDIPDGEKDLWTPMTRRQKDLFAKSCMEEIIVQDDLSRAQKRRLLSKFKKDTIRKIEAENLHVKMIDSKSASELSSKLVAGLENRTPARTSKPGS